MALCKYNVFNHWKTSYMIFRSRNKKLDPGNEIFINGCKLDCHLTWKCHINYVQWVSKHINPGCAVNHYSFAVIVHGVIVNWSFVCDLNRTPIVMAKHGGSCVHFSGLPTCGRTSREIVSHPQRPPLPTLYKISLPVYVIVTNKRLQPLTKTWYNSIMLSLSLLKI